MVMILMLLALLLVGGFLAYRDRRHLRRWGYALLGVCILVCVVIWVVRLPLV